MRFVLHDIDTGLLKAVEKFVVCPLHACDLAGSAVDLNPDVVSDHVVRGPTGGIEQFHDIDILTVPFEDRLRNVHLWRHEAQALISRFLDT
ncbi:hypothetical protein HYG81_24205 (plasmid) [Natrinema zhouii]|nr:hypothetical protein [Natrinema zhouii]UHQ98875.1 hypothetical protein HYG81_24205 [Natrinema zhouii]